MSSPTPSSASDPTARQQLIDRSTTPPDESSAALSPAERFASLKDRLEKVSSKHHVRRLSNEAMSTITSTALSSEDQTSKTPPFRPNSPASQSDPVQRNSSPSTSIPPTSTAAVTTSSSYTRPKKKRTIPSELDEIAAMAASAALSAGPARSSSCACNRVLNPSDVALCLSCSGALRPIVRVEQERLRALQSLLESRQKLNKMRLQEETSIKELRELEQKAEEMEDLVDAKTEEIARLQRDLQTLGEKVVDEIEKRAELQASKDGLQDELEELTKSLFEEANVMVADEARRRHLHETREKTLEQELADMRVQLQREQLQLKELKAKMEEARMVEMMDEEAAAAAEEELAGAILGSTAGRGGGVRGGQGTAPDPIDPLLLNEFKEFLTQGPTVKLNKLHTLPFMKNALEDDVTSCLRFGGSPRTSTRRLIEAIVMNSCFVAEMSAVQISALNALHQELKVATEAAAAIAAAAAEKAAADKAKRPTTTISALTSVAGLTGSLQSGDSTASGETPTASAGVDASGAIPSPAQPSTPNPASAILAPETEKTLAALQLAPTQAIFQKTMMERISTWSTSTGLSGTGPNLPPGLVINGCSACGRVGPTRHQFKITEQADDSWCPICSNCRDRLVSVCEFYNFVRHVRQGLYSTRRHEDLYLEVMALRRKMFYSRIGAFGHVTAGPDKPFARPRSLMSRPESTVMLQQPQPSGSPEPPVAALTVRDVTSSVPVTSSITMPAAAFSK
ncbi:RAB3A interacting protein [Blyttiomyces sp. JEL0837]|nr:RAB3A interacting protein [Blyttiomyces sp. JEL0837]